MPDGAPVPGEPKGTRGEAGGAIPAGPARGPLPGAGYALALLLAINLFNYIDRQILSATLPKIKLDAGIVRPDDPWLQTKLGLLTTAFMVSYMLFSPVFGWLGDRASRWALVGVGVILWSLATGGTGLATGYLVLLLTRCFVGIGEAAYGPVAPSMLSDLYPVDHRGRVMAWFYMAIPVGSALGFVIGGQVAETTLGWRGAFLVPVIPGLVLGVLCFFMREPPRKGSGGAAPNGQGPSYLDVLKELRGVRSFVLCCAGMTASTFVLGGVAAWVPVYIFEREARFTLTDKAVEKLDGLKTSAGQPVVPPAVVDKLRPLVGPGVMTTAEFRAKLEGALTAEEFRQYASWVYDAAPAEGSMTTGKIGLYFGAILVVGGLVATLLGGVLGDYLRNRGVRGAYFHVAGWSTLLGFPFFLAMLFVPFPLAWVMIFFTVFALFFNTGPANTVLANVSRSEIRASAFAINILIIHALGDAISPTLIGAVADVSDLHTAFLVTSFFLLLAGGLWVAGSRYLDADTARAEGVSGRA
jgi:MFS family permease